MQLPKPDDFKDPFNAGQMVGMLMMLIYIERRGGISHEAMEQLKQLTAGYAQIYLEKPSEDIFLMLDEMIKEMEL